MTARSATPTDPAGPYWFWLLLRLWAALTSWIAQACGVTALASMLFTNPDTEPGAQVGVAAHPARYLVGAVVAAAMTVLLLAAAGALVRGASSGPSARMRWTAASASRASLVVLVWWMCSSEVVAQRPWLVAVIVGYFLGAVSTTLVQRLRRLWRRTERWRGGQFVGPELIAMGIPMVLYSGELARWTAVMLQSFVFGVAVVALASWIRSQRAVLRTWHGSARPAAGKAYFAAADQALSRGLRSGYDVKGDRG